MKLAMLADVLPRNFLTPNMRIEVMQLAEYITLFHGPYFLQARLPTAAPRLDLEMWRNMNSYEVSNKSKLFIVIIGVGIVVFGDF